MTNIYVNMGLWTLHSQPVVWKNIQLKPADFLGFEVLVAVSMKMAVFWVVLYRLVRKWMRVCNMLGIF
jgi:hypothetical protein